MAENQYYYNTTEYKEKLEELELVRERIRAEKEQEAQIKEKEMKRERIRLKKIFTDERCGSSNHHFVSALIDRAAFLRVELEHMEETLRKDGVLDFFTQGLQTMWREHPISKIHVQYIKNYKDVIGKLESYGSQQDAPPIPNNDPLLGIFNRGASAREKYKK